MGLTRNYLLSLLLYVSIVNEIRLPQVTCQDDEGSQCIPKRAFIALLRLPEVNSNLAAYSRTARVIQDAKSRNDMAELKALSEEGDETEICIPGSIYLELFRDPAMRGHLAAIGRNQKLPDFSGRLFEESEEVDDGELMADYPKRSIAMLAKNDDLPISILGRDEEQDDEEKRSIASEHMSMVLRRLLNEDSRRTATEILREYLLPNGDLDLEALARDFPMEKRNVGSLARDFALPTGRRNVASLARDYGLPSGKRNVGALARDRMLPTAGKKNVASLAKSYMLPPNGKRNIAALARDDILPFGKRYLGSLGRFGGFPLGDEDKRSVASLARNSDFPMFVKRGVSAPGSLILRTLARHGRSLNPSIENEPLNLQELTNQDSSVSRKLGESSLGDSVAEEEFGDGEARNRSNRRMEAAERRTKRRIDFSDEYPSPVMQNGNVIDYEEMMDALDRQYPNDEKRFMGTDSSMEPKRELPQLGTPEIFQTYKRHIAALASKGWLPTPRTSRFSRSSRDLLGRENPADGSATANDSPNPQTWPLRPSYNPGIRYIRALHGDCRHGFKRYLLLPAVDNNGRRNF